MEWLRLFPKEGPLPQELQTFAMSTNYLVLKNERGGCRDPGTMPHRGPEYQRDRA
jgi:hypothetical protein